MYEISINIHEHANPEAIKAMLQWLSDKDRDWEANLEELEGSETIDVGFDRSRENKPHPNLVRWVTRSDCGGSDDTFICREVTVTPEQARNRERAGLKTVMSSYWELFPFEYSDCPICGPYQPIGSESTTENGFMILKLSCGHHVITIDEQNIIINEKGTVK